MSKHENFTAERVANFKCSPGKQQTIYWDGKTPGLGLRATKAGGKSYIFETQLHGKTLRITIGDTRIWSISKAQTKATEYKLLTDQGIDPRQQLAEQRANHELKQADAKRKTILVGEAWAAYLKHHEKRWGARHLADHVNLSQSGGQPKKRSKQLTTPGVLAPLMKMRMTDMTSDLLTEWQAKEANSRANNARQGFELFRAFWRWCASRAEYRAIIDAQIVENRDLRAQVPSRKSKKFDVLQRAHLAPWFAAVRSLNNPVISAYLQAVLLTGARREEMAALRWQEVDFQWNSLWVKDKVMEEGRKIPLTPYLSHLLANLPRRNAWVFSSLTAADGKIAEPRIAHKRALSIAGLEHVTLHGLRRTFASLAEWVEIPQGIVAQIMGHAPNATAEKHYINRPLELLATWHTKYEAWILKEAGIAFNPEQKVERLRAIK